MPGQRGIQETRQVRWYSSDEFTPAPPSLFVDEFHWSPPIIPARYWIPDPWTDTDTVLTLPPMLAEEQDWFVPIPRPRVWVPDPWTDGDYVPLGLIPGDGASAPPSQRAYTKPFFQRWAQGDELPVAPTPFGMDEEPRPVLYVSDASATYIVWSESDDYILVGGRLATTNANDTSVGTGSPTVTGSSATTNANDTLAAAGSPTVSGALNQSNANDTLSAAGAVGGGTGTTGTVNYTNNDDTNTSPGFSSGAGDYPKKRKKRLVVQVGSKVEEFQNEAEAVAALNVQAAQEDDAAKRKQDEDDVTFLLTNL